MQITEFFSIMESYDTILIVCGFGILGISSLLHRFKGKPFSYPIVAFALGFGAFAIASNLSAPDPKFHNTWIVHITELGVIVSLMGVGLKIDRFPNFKTWLPAWRLLGITMPLTIIGVAALGYFLVGLSAAAAVLLGAVLAPTDPVLAADVQVGKPDENTDDNRQSEEQEDEVRFALTAEAGFNDSLAFPFTYLALLMASKGLSPTNWFEHWLFIDVIYKVSLAVVIGLILGKVLAKILLTLPADNETQKMRTGVGALAATLLIYGTAEFVGCYGFLAVIVGALTIRHRERTHQSHRSLHVFSEQAEQLFMTGILIALGGAVAGGLLAPVTWEIWLVSLLLIFVIRPIAGLIGFLGSGRTTRIDRIVISFFGIRGIGTLYYLAYALDQYDFAEADTLWAICTLTIIISLIVHGISAAPAMNFRKRHKIDESSG